MSRQRFEISIKYKDHKGVDRYANNVGNVWLDLETGKGSIDLPPGVALVGGQAGVYINVSTPRPREGQQGGQRQGGGYKEQAGVGDDDIGF